MRSSEKNMIRHLIILVCLFSLAFSKDDNPNTLAKPSTLEFVQFTGNNINSWMGNNGHFASNYPTGDAGGEWPAGSGKTVIFASGIWVAAKVNGDLRTAAAEASSEWTPGIIPYNTQTGLPISDSPENTTDHQIYFIQQDNSSDPSSVNYNREFSTWPASEGAPAHDGEVYSDQNQNGERDSGEPYEDFNRDGNYNPPDGHLVTGDDPPKFQGDEMAWWVMNGWGSAAHDNLWRTQPLGLEAQVTVYNRSADPIYENIQFHDVKLVNKSGGNLDSVFYAYWSDVDLGDANDDNTGCDPDLSLGYYYNQNPNDQDYGMTPPAVGYVFLQGPIIESIGDSVEYNGISLTDMKNLEMTSFVFMVGSDNRYGDPENAREAFYMLQGLNHAGEYFVDPWGVETVFLASGDPVHGTGWLGTSYGSDKRNIMSMGPFDMEPWDDLNQNGKADFGEPGVQMIQSALIVIGGADHLDAITSLKYTAEKVHSDYALGFESPQLDPPRLSASANDQEIILNWFTAADEYESLIVSGYDFEGYNVYQGETPRGPWSRLYTYDVVNGIGYITEQVMDDYGIVGTEPVQFGDDAGLAHLLSITEDALNESAPLTNNKLYHFALSAYGYNEDMIPKSLESAKQIISIRPHQTYETAGVRDTLAVEYTGNADVEVTIDVLDPGQLTDLNYKLGFEYDSTSESARWHVTRRSISFEDTALLGEWTETQSVFHEFRPRSELRLDNAKLYLDGFELSLKKMSLTAPWLSDGWKQTVNVRGDSSWVESYLAVSPGGVDSLFILDGDTLSLSEYLAPVSWRYFNFSIREQGLQTWFDIPREATHSVVIQAFGSNFGGIGGDRLADIPNIGGGSLDPDFLQSDLEIRFTQSGQKATKYQRRRNDSLITIPFEVWDIERNRQLCVGIKDNNKTGGIQDTSLENWENTLDLDWIITFDRDYGTYADSIQPLINNPHSGWVWQFNNESRFSVGDLLTVHFLNPLDPEVDEWHWTTAVIGRAYDEDTLQKIQVFPNPYFGYHTDQTTTSGPLVTFSNLPAGECIIRIYSLGGQLVKRLDHEFGAYEHWNLLNEYNHAVASGIYIVHIEVPELGNRILKLAVFQ